MQILFKLYKSYKSPGLFVKIKIPEEKSLVLAAVTWEILHQRLIIKILLIMLFFINAGKE